MFIEWYCIKRTLFSSSLRSSLIILHCDSDFCPVFCGGLWGGLIFCLISASRASHMNTSIFLQRKEWQGEILETEAAWLTGLIWRGPKMSKGQPLHHLDTATTSCIVIWIVALNTNKDGRMFCGGFYNKICIL